MLVVASCDANGEDTTTTAGSTPDTADTTTTEATETTTTMTSTTTPPPRPTVHMASGDLDPLSADVVPLASAFDSQAAGASIQLDLIGIEGYKPTPKSNETFLLAPRWRVLPGADPNQGSCVYKAESVVISETTLNSQAFKDAITNAGLTLPTSSDTPIGSLGGQSIVEASVDPDQELAIVFAALASGGLASLHYPVPPQPKWDYGPASDRQVLSSNVESQLAPTPAVKNMQDLILVLDHFGGTSRTLESEVAEFVEGLENPDVALITDELMTSKQAVDGHGEFILAVLRNLGVEAAFEHVSLKADVTPDEESLGFKVAAAAQPVLNLSLGAKPCTVKFDAIEALPNPDQWENLLAEFSGPVLDRLLNEDTLLAPIALAASLRTRADKIEGLNWVVAATGNSGQPGSCAPPWFPAAYTQGAASVAAYLEVIDAVDQQLAADVANDIEIVGEHVVAVGATEPADGAELSVNRAGFSQCSDAGTALVGAQTWAPGTSIIAMVDGELIAWSGTSFAAPQIAGAIAAGIWAP